MRNLLMIIVLAIAMTFMACEQKEAAPTKVKVAFEQKFPNAQNVKWDKENSKEWEAEFSMDNKEYSANFSTDGSWLETEYKVELSEVSDAVKATLAADFEAYKIKEAEISISNEARVYEFELEKGGSDIEVAISPEGNIIKKENKEEEKDSEEKD